MTKIYSLCALFSILLIVSCIEQKKYKKIKFNKFSIVVQNDWEKVERNGIDSDIGAIKINDKDTIFFDYGTNTAIIDDVVFVQSMSDYKEMLEKEFDISSYHFSKTPNVDKNQGIFHKEFYMYDTIDNYIVKIKIPKKIENGITAICFDSLNPMKERLYMYGKNIEEHNNKELLKAFKTIKFNKK